MLPHPWPDPRTRAGFVFYAVIGLALGMVLANLGWRI